MIHGADPLGCAHRQFWLSFFLENAMLAILDPDGISHFSN
jgi:hypothetical protein